MPITQKQIAERLGVSPQAVGFALRGDGTLSQEMRQRVLQMASQMGYDRFSNNEARVLSSQRHGKRAPTGMIAVLQDRDFNGIPLREVPYFTPLLDGIEIEAMQLGLDVLMCPLHQDRMPRLVREEKVDGLIILAWQDQIWEKCRDLEIPKVGLVASGEGDLALEVNDEEGAYLVTKHLLAMGHRKIGVLSIPLSTYLGRTRSAGYRRAMTEAGIDPSEFIINDSLPYVTLDEAAAGAARLLEDHPDVTAIFGLGDMVAIGALQQVQRVGLRVPEDICVVGMDDFSAPYNLSPTLTSVSFAHQKMGRRAVQWLYEITMNGGNKPSKVVREVYPPTLHIRESSSPLRN